MDTYENKAVSEISAALDATMERILDAAMVDSSDAGKLASVVNLLTLGLTGLDAIHPDAQPIVLRLVAAKTGDLSILKDPTKLAAIFERADKQEKGKVN